MGAMYASAGPFIWWLTASMNLMYLALFFSSKANSSSSPQTSSGLGTSSCPEAVSSQISRSLDKRILKPLVPLSTWEGGFLTIMNLAISNTEFFSQ